MRFTTTAEAVVAMKDRKIVLEGRLVGVKAQLLDARTAVDNLIAARNQFEGALAMLNELIATEPTPPEPKLKSV